MIDKRVEPLLSNSAAIKITNVLAVHGFETRFVGGCVRDALAQRTIGDIDLATTALPEQIIEFLGKADIKTIPTGIDHGTVTAIIASNPYEITTLRKDVSTDGRRATVAFTDNWQEDAMRRDFTINALSMDKNGVIADYSNGIKDIQEKRLSFIGDAKERIHEDYLRLLRYFRFASVLDWEINDRDTLEICQTLAVNLKSLSRERIQGELYKLLLGTGCLRVMTIMQQYHILSGLIGEIDIERLKTTITSEKKYHQHDPFRRLLALTGPLQYDRLEQFIVLSRDNKKRVEDLKKIAGQRNEKLAKLLYFCGPQAVKDFYFLNDTSWDYDEIEQTQKPEFPLKAVDVFHLTGGAGPEVGRKLSAAENYWVDQDFKPSKTELLDFLNR